MLININKQNKQNKLISDHDYSFNINKYAIK